MSEIKLYETDPLTIEVFNGGSVKFSLRYRSEIALLLTPPEAGEDDERMNDLIDWIKIKFGG